MGVTQRRRDLTKDRDFGDIRLSGQEKNRPQFKEKEKNNSPTPLHPQKSHVPWKEDQSSIGRGRRSHGRRVRVEGNGREKLPQPPEEKEKKGVG